MRQYILASHGYLAQGMKSSLELILGDGAGTYEIKTLCAYVDENQDLASQIEALLASSGEEDQVVVLTDIFGGSVNNEFIKYMDRYPFYLVAGMSLPLLVELATSSQNPDLEGAIARAVSNAAGSLVYCNALREPSQADEEF